MRKSFLFIISILMTSVLFGQPLTGIKTIPGVVPNGYSSITSAISDLNSQGVGSGGVIFNIAPGYIETLTSTLSIVATGTFTDPIIFQKSGAGINPVITAYGSGVGTPASAIQDGIWNLVGSDYVTIDGIDLVDPNAANPATMEYGYGLFKANATDGCQHNTIKNCVITLNRVNNATGTAPAMDGSRAIQVSNSLATTQTTVLAPTAASGTNSFNGFYSNTLQNCNIGISLSGYAASSPFTLGDTGNDIGGASISTGNTVINFGGGGSTSPSAGIRANNQWSLNISYNIVNNNNGSGVNHTTTLRGIYAQAATSANVTITFNNVTVNGGGTTASVYGIDNGIGSTASSNTVNVNNNTVTGSYPTATTGTYTAIQNTATAAIVNLNNNVVSGISTPGTGILIGIYGGGPTALNLMGNSVGTLTKTGNGIIYGIQALTSTVTCSGNTVDGLIRNSASSTNLIVGIYSGSSAAVESYSSNIIRNLTATGTAALHGLFISSATGNKTIQGNQFYNYSVAGAGTIYGINMAYGSTDLISNNQIHDLSITGATSGTIYGLRIAAGSLNSIFNNAVNALSCASGTSGAVYGIHISTATTNNIYKNQVYNLSSGSSNPSLYGVYVLSGTTNNVYNNFISDLRTPAANAGIPLAGIYVAGGTNANLFYNTIYLAGSSTGALFGSASVYASVSTTLEMRNNILINLSAPKGTGVSSAYRRSGTDLTTYSVNSNANVFYAGVAEDATHAVFYNGTTPYSMAAYQALAGPVRESVSSRELPPFINVAATPYNLHLEPAISTACESGGLQVTTPLAITDDIDGVIRQGNNGYTGNGTAPDIGADEFNGIPNFTCTLPNPGNTQTTNNNLCLGEGITLSLQNTIPGTGNTYQWQSSANGVSFTDIAGANGTSFYLVPEESSYYRCLVTCHAGPFSAASVPIRITFAHQVLTTTPGSRCGAGSVQLAATISDGTINWYPTASGGTPIGSGSPFTTPSIGSTTTYYVAADIPAVTGQILGAGASTGSGWESPFAHTYGGKKSQYLITASELSAAGLVAGNITSLAFEVVVPASTYNAFNISIGPTALTAMTSTLQSGLTNVYSATSVTPFAGINAYTFATPFNWDGSSNIIVETCWSNNNAGGVSASVKYDVTAFVSQGYYRADNALPATLCAVTTGSSTTSSRPKIYFNHVPQCSGLRTAVPATIIPPPALTISGSQTVCSETAYQINVTSTIGDYDTYTWSPATNLFTDLACTVPYVAGQSAATVYAKSAAAVSTVYTCSANNSSTGCVNTAQTTVTFMPGNVAIAANPSEICISGSSMLTIAPSNGYGDATFQWQDSPDNVVFTNIPGATAITYTTPTISSQTYYRLIIKNQSGNTCLQPQVTIPVSNPQATSTTSGSRCGAGTVVLQATGTGGGTLKWFAAASGGDPVGAGSPFTTPVLSSTTSYYVAQVFSPNGTATIGAGATTSSTYPDPFHSGWGNSHNQYLVKASELTSIGYSAGKITSLAINVTSGTIAVKEFSIKMGNTTASAMTAFVSTTFTNVYYAATQTPVFGLNTFTFTTPFIWDGVSNIVIETCFGNSASSSATANSCTADNTPFTSVIHVHKIGANAGSVVCGDNSSSLATYTVRPRFSFGFTGCESPRTEVIATVTTAPAISPTATPSTVCSGSPSNLNVTSANPNYTYTWMPGNLSGASQTVNPVDTTTYTVSATDPATGCIISEAVTVTVAPTPAPVVITPSSPIILTGQIQPLTATGGESPELLIFSENFNAPLNNWTTVNNSTGGSPFYAAWTLTPNGYPYQSNDQSQFYLSNSNDQGSGGTTDTELISPAISTIGYSSLTLSFYHAFQYLNEDSQAKVEVSTDGGNSWNPTPLVSYTSTQGTSMGWPHVLIDMSSYVNQGNLKIRFRYHDTWGWFWCVDNVSITGRLQTTIAWSPFTDLYTDLAATIPYSGEPLITVYAKPDSTATYTATSTVLSTLCTNAEIVTVTVLSACEPPSGVTNTEISAYTATLLWTSPVPSPFNGYEYELRTSGAPGSGPDGLWTVGLIADTSASFAWLNPSTTYYFYVRSVCAGGIYSPWTPAYPFTTLIEPLAVNAEIVNVSCYGDSDGALYALATGGTEPYTFLWSTGDTTTAITGLSAGTYTVTVTDASSVVAINSWIVGTPEPLSLSFIAEPVSCYGSSDGYIIAYPWGGTSPHFFSWSNGSTSMYLYSLSAGIYTVTMTDAHGCELVETVEINQPDILTLSAVVNHASCAESNDGSIDLTVTGGNPPYFYYEWSNGSTTEDISGLTAGDYSVTVTDGRSCVQTATFTVGLNSVICENIIVAGDISTTLCYNALNTITVAGGTATFVVEPAGHATFIAGVKIRFLEGTKVLPGGYMLGKITLTNEFCSTSKMTEVAGRKDETPLMTERSFFSLFPNPTNGNFTLVQKGDRKYANVKVEVYSMSGEKILTESMIGEMKHEFRFADVPNGLYFVKVVADDYVETIKLVKVR